MCDGGSRSTSNFVACALNLKAIIFIICFPKEKTHTTSFRKDKEEMPRDIINKGHQTIMVVELHLPKPVD